MKRHTLGGKLGVVLLASLVVLSATFMDVNLVSALSCQCNNGIAVETSPQCICECLDNYQLPDCDYKVNEDVRLDVYLDLPASEFTSTTFLKAVDAGTSLDADTTTFLYAVVLDSFNKTNVLITMPGYGVRRFLPLVEAQEVWVQQEHIEAVYVIPLPAGRSNTASSFPTFDYGGATITVEGWSWLASGILLVTIGVCLECCCMANTEDVVAQYPDSTFAKFNVRQKSQDFTSADFTMPVEQQPSVTEYRTSFELSLSRQKESEKN